MSVVEEGRREKTHRGAQIASSRLGRERSLRLLQTRTPNLQHTQQGLDNFRSRTLVLAFLPGLTHQQVLPSTARDLRAAVPSSADLLRDVGEEKVENLEGVNTDDVFEVREGGDGEKDKSG
jgi:hypothetical protein